MTPPRHHAPGIGEAIHLRREELGLSLEDLGRQLHFPLSVLEAIEAEDWAAIPPGRERPMVRQLMVRLDMDPSLMAESWASLPGGLEQDPPDPRKDYWERLLTGIISLCALALVLWLVLPGPNIKRGIQEPRADHPKRPPVTRPATASQPYAVLGELLPEAGVNAEGILVSLRSQEECQATLQGEHGQQSHTLRISEPWKLRVPGPFQLSLSNGGVVLVEVAGKRIRHPAAVGQPWSGNFGADGRLILPATAQPDEPPSAPETEEDEAATQDESTE
nr:helix-turn-helix domain-containing protein [uncultured Holophaga sp.]